MSFKEFVHRIEIVEFISSGTGEQFPKRDMKKGRQVHLLASIRNYTKLLLKPKRLLNPESFYYGYNEFSPPLIL